MNHRSDSIYAKVEQILHKVEAACDDEKLLIVTYWLAHDNIASCLDDLSIPDNLKSEIINRIAKAMIERATIPETITRAKRKIIELYRNGGS